MNLALEARVEADLRDLPGQVRDAVWRRLESLRQDPQGPGTGALAGNLAGLRRLRIGDYRAAYLVDGDTIRVFAVAHRSRIYELARRRMGS